MLMRRSLLVWFCAVGVLGCASLAPVDPNGLAGRLSVRVEGASGEPARSISGGFELLGDAERGRLNLSTPLGTMLAQASWSPQQVALVTAQGQATYSDMAALTRELLGTALPVEALFDWLRGRPWPGAASRANDSPAAAGFTQLGWQVNLSRFDEGFIDARRVEPPLVTVRAKLDRP